MIRKSTNGLIIIIAIVVVLTILISISKKKDKMDDETQQRATTDIITTAEGIQKSTPDDNVMIVEPNNKGTIKSYDMKWGTMQPVLARDKDGNRLKFSARGVCTYSTSIENSESLEQYMRSQIHLMVDREAYQWISNLEDAKNDSSTIIAHFEEKFTNYVIEKDSQDIVITYFKVSDINFVN